MAVCKQMQFNSVYTSVGLKLRSQLKKTSKST